MDTNRGKRSRDNEQQPIQHPNEALHSQLPHISATESLLLQQHQQEQVSSTTPVVHKGALRLLAARLQLLWLRQLKLYSKAHTAATGEITGTEDETNDSALTGHDNANGSDNRAVLALAEETHQCVAQLQQGLRGYTTNCVYAAMTQELLRERAEMMGMLGRIRTVMPQVRHGLQQTEE